MLQDARDGDDGRGLVATSSAGPILGLVATASQEMADWIAAALAGKNPKVARENQAGTA